MKNKQPRGYRKIDPQNPIMSDNAYQLSLWDRGLQKLEGVTMQVRTILINPGDEITYFLIVRPDEYGIHEDRFYTEAEASDLFDSLDPLSEGQKAFYVVSLKRKK